MRRPINWLVFALSLGFLALGRALQAPPPAPSPAPLVIERMPVVPVVATAVPAAYRASRAELEFGYVDRER